jgi:hypothetical protein
LAAQYRDGLLIRQASHSFSPLVLLRATLRLATKGAFGTLVFLLGFIGYVIGANLVLTALIKPILPAHTGLWVNNGHFISAGIDFLPPESGYHEVLGLWYIPIALTLGSLTLLLTTFLIRRSLRISQQLQSKL